MEAMQVSIQSTPCCDPLPDLEVPMINTMVACLGSERNWIWLPRDWRPIPTRLARINSAIEVWAEIRRSLWSHLQIEDELVFSWGEAHHAIPGTFLETPKIERKEMRELIGALAALSSDLDREPQTAENRGEFARTLLALTRTLDTHVERFDREVLPSILRAVFHQ